MTDARPEPDKIEADSTSAEVRPEPVWARPAAPDPWGEPTPVETPIVSSARSSFAGPAEERPDAREQDQAQGLTQEPVREQDQAEGPAQEPVREQDPVAGSPSVLESRSEDQPTQATVPAPPAAANPQPEYAQPEYPDLPRYPQYTAPQGFGSPQGPEPVASPPTGPGLPLPGQFGQPSQFGQPGEPGQSGQPGRPAEVVEVGPPGLLGQPDPNAGPNPNAPSVPWYGDAGQPTQQFGGGPGWPAQPYPVVDGGRKKGRVALIALLVGVCLLVGVLGGVAGSALRDDVTDASGRNPTISLPAPAPVDANRATSQVTTVAAAVLPSVVSINVQAGDEAGTGSGFVIDAAKGYILTNNHVVTAGGTAAATSIEVVFQDGTQVPGKVVGLDASYDLAVVKVTAKGLRQLTLGDSDAVRVGDPVVAIGAPLGLQGTVTTGIVSALNRPVAAGEGNKPAFINAIQTDAAINPGNSGGPLVDASGNVIAVNSAIARSPGSLSTSAGNIGLGFAIPSNQARRTAEQLIRTGKASHPIIGVSLDSQYTGRGVKVSAQPSADGVKPVTVNGPADQAGIKAGDVILKIDGRPVTEPDELIVAIRAQTPGETITLTVQRGKSESEVRVKLSEATD